MLGSSTMKCSSNRRKIASNLLLRGGELLANPIVEVDGSGTILSVECGAELDRSQIDRSPSTEFYAGVMVAGFVNAHSHLELSYLRGAIEPHCGFSTFAAEIASRRGAFSAEERLRAIRKADAEMWREGVAAVGDISNGESSFATKAQSPIEYRNFAEIFGLRTHSLREIEGLESLLKQPHTTATPHSTYSLNDALFREVVAHSSQQSPLSIHFMESEGEEALFRGEGYLAQWYRRMGFECDFLGYGSPAQRVVESIPSDRSLLLVHNCSLRQEDIDIIMGHFTAPLYWVLCPRSNSYISALTPPLELLRRNGLNICVGTDSLASNWSLSMVEELKTMRSVPLAERLDWATRVGAAALGLSHLGDIEVGKRPGINILSGVDYRTLELTERSRVRRII